ncbi:hypothetical protein JCM10908_006381 [Rhodotorula pacifica]|uniref:uncharacterized protein n=1 Tax=Rhodotorula pacifica TaxID=1495444 RepID=UPI0031759AB0
MPPLIDTPLAAMPTYRGTTDRHEQSAGAGAAAAAVRLGFASDAGGAAASTSAGATALASSRRAYWTNEQQLLQQSFERYHSHRHELLQLPYPTPPAASQPPQPATVPIHRVYILRCATCDTFLSDRGMRAVLLLKPHIILFSTDSAPANSATFWPDGPAHEQVERTCECLTSSISCHGCGKTVGYNIVSPCSKCNASVQKHQRSANHHRFVFHHNEVTARERTYYPGEAGVSNPIVRLQPSPASSRDSSRTPTPLARTRESEAADKDAPALRSSRLRTVSPAARARDRGLRLLKSGDTVYWHMLVPGGERSKSIDPRMREPAWSENVGR